ncbi:TPA: hypothetical protein N0F65_008097 [Lagenidium giganteum]|uniref:Calcineurin-like phosphoesterase domain-containing protein n=1 Tax=Lagenidium giganteum TaxID=4803 RepID=A0AAV2YWA0_9STRA|nr:TPA: hypothetical protein N0F65_008097 [Lagenidium giganteum]
MKLALVAWCAAWQLVTNAGADAFLRSEEQTAVGVNLVATEAADMFTVAICKSPSAALFLGVKCPTSNSNNVAPGPAPVLSDTATYAFHALAIGDWGVDVGLGSCCNKYRKTGTNTEAYYKDRQAQPNVAYLLSLSAARLKPKVIIGHGDNFYWNGVGSDDVDYRFQNTFEEMYSQDSLKGVRWINVMGNHDYGGANYICGKWDYQFYRCPNEAELLKQLEERFTRQSQYKSPNNDRWKMPAHYYVETLKDDASGVTVDIFNVDSNAATVHGGEQICCQCYGYMTEDGGNINCNDVHRGHKYCMGGDTALFDKCLAKVKSWQDDSMQQLARDAKSSKATWKVVNSHYSPHFHMEPNMMNDWFKVLSDSGVQVFFAGHTHAESHEFAVFNTHFFTNGAGGGIQSESIGAPPPYATQVQSLWTGADNPYGFFELSFGKEQMRAQFITFDNNWSFKMRLGDTVKGGTAVGHCWLIPKDGTLGRACAS